MAAELSLTRYRSPLCRTFRCASRELECLLCSSSVHLHHPSRLQCWWCNPWRLRFLDLSSCFICFGFSAFWIFLFCLCCCLSLLDLFRSVFNCLASLFCCICCFAFCVLLTLWFLVLFVFFSDYLLWFLLCLCFVVLFFDNRFGTPVWKREGRVVGGATPPPWLVDFFLFLVSWFVFIWLSALIFVVSLFCWFVFW